MPMRCSDSMLESVSHEFGATTEVENQGLTDVNEYASTAFRKLYLARSEAIKVHLH